MDLNPPVPEHADALHEGSVAFRRTRHDEEAPEEDDPPSFQTAPVSASVPLFHPTFFLKEALAFLEKLGSAGGLGFACLTDVEEDSDADPQLTSVTNDSVGRAWVDLHQSVYGQLPQNARERIQFWTKDECAHVYAYNSALEELRRDFDTEGVEVVPIQLADHEGTAKTLCVWQIDRPVVLPATDLILVARPQRRRLFRAPQVDERLLPASDVWSLLQPFAERRYEPAPILIYRNPPDRSSSLIADLDRLGGERVENAHAAGFAGIVDIDLDPRGVDPTELHPSELPSGE